MNTCERTSPSRPWGWLDPGPVPWSSLKGQSLQGVWLLPLPLAPSCSWDPPAWSARPMAAPAPGTSSFWGQVVTGLRAQLGQHWERVSNGVSIPHSSLSPPALPCQTGAPRSRTSRVGPGVSTTLQVEPGLWGWGAVGNDWHPCSPAAASCPLASLEAPWSHSSEDMGAAPFRHLPLLLFNGCLQPLPLSPCLAPLLPLYIWDQAASS